MTTADAPLASPTGTVACYTEGAPSTTCTLPTHCCFSGYSSAHNGYCSNSACAFGTILCDGPEDCAGGQLCCAHATVDPYDGITAWMLACQPGPCGAPPLSEELCHDTCSAGTCTSGANPDFPRTLSVCR